MLIDANLLLYAVDAEAPEHERAARWLAEQLNGHRRVALPWESIGAFVRIATHPRASSTPVSAVEAWGIVESWLAVPTVWSPVPTDQHAAAFGDLLRRYRPTGNLIPDTHLAALAIEHGLEICSADTDFARFTEVRWRNPLTT
jgi:hypothetical protein